MGMETLARSLVDEMLRSPDFQRLIEERVEEVLQSAHVDLDLAGNEGSWPEVHIGWGDCNGEWKELEIHWEEGGHQDDVQKQLANLDALMALLVEARAALSESQTSISMLPSASGWSVEANGP